MRYITHLVVHCSATPPSSDIGRDSIDSYHRSLGWQGIGYHYVIRRSGLIEIGRPIEQVGAHVSGHNSHSVGICLIGGTDTKGKAQNNFTLPQFTSLRKLLDVLLLMWPAADICGHRDFPGVAKDCPCFDVRQWLREARQS